MNEFNLEYQYQKYLELVDMPERSMCDSQRTDTRSAFMAAAGILLVMFREKLSVLPHEEAMEVLEDLEFQVVHFWVCQAMIQVK